jgi:Fic family protein
MMEGRIVKGIWIPIEIWEAQDLSWNEKILLMEIDSFTTKGKDCFISDEYVADLLRVSERTARTMISDLIKKGYVRKTKFDGRRRFLESTLSYQIGKICRAEMQDLPTTYNNIPIEEDKSSSNNIKRSSRYDFKKALLEIGVSEQTAKDWMEVRKERKAANTETAFHGVEREILKSGRSAEECIRLAVENSWRGFKAEWLFNQQQSKPNGRKVSVLENNMNVTEELLRMQMNL